METSQDGRPLEDSHSRCQLEHLRIAERTPAQILTEGRPVPRGSVFCEASEVGFNLFDANVADARLQVVQRAGVGRENDLCDLQVRHGSKSVPIIASPVRISDSRAR
jgi:hypothetical protein